MLSEQNCVVQNISHRSDNKKENNGEYNKMEARGKGSLRGSSLKHGTMHRQLAWPLRKDDTHKARSVNDINISEDHAEFSRVAIPIPIPIPISIPIPIPMPIPIPIPIPIPVPTPIIYAHIEKCK